MFANIRAPEILLILLIIVLLFGATKLPALAQSVGKSFKIFKKEVQPDADPSATAPDLLTPNDDGKTSSS